MLELTYKNPNEALELYRKVNEASDEAFKNISTPSKVVMCNVNFMSERVELASNNLGKYLYLRKKDGEIFFSVWDDNECEYYNDDETLIRNETEFLTSYYKHLFIFTHNECCLEFEGNTAKLQGYFNELYEFCNSKLTDSPLSKNLKSVTMKNKVKIIYCSGSEGIESFEDEINKFLHSKPGIYLVGDVEVIKLKSGLIAVINYKEEE